MENKNNPVMAVVVPCYNEEEVLPETIKVLSNWLTDLINQGILSEQSFLMFIDDGSKDETWDIIETASKKNDHIKGIKFSRNFGHQFALLAGMESIKDKCDVTLTIDADLQDDISVVREGIEKIINNGYDIVYFARKQRKTDSFFKKTSAVAFYKFISLLGVDIVYNHADFRLVTNRILQELEYFKEVNVFLRAMFPIMGFKSDIIYYDRKERLAGVSKYPFMKMLAFAWEGITSFSIAPLR